MLQVLFTFCPSNLNHIQDYHFKPNFHKKNLGLNEDEYECYIIDQYINLLRTCTTPTAKPPRAAIM